MKLLVLGAHFAGRAVVVHALRRRLDGDGVQPGTDAGVPGVETLRGDRRDAGALRELGARRWDAVFDTWSDAPWVVPDSARALAAAGRYLYVSSGSVYAPPPPVDGDETAPTVDASPDAERRSTRPTCPWPPGCAPARSARRSRIRGRGCARSTCARPQRSDRPPVGLDPERERALLLAVAPG